jgi:hypothetical protein
MSVLPSRRRTTRGLAGVAAAVLAVALVGCGGESEQFEWPDDPPSEDAADQPQQLTPADPAEAEAIEQVLTVLNQFRELEVEAHAKATPSYVARRQLSAYLADPLLSQTIGTLDGMQRAGIVFEGRPTWSPTVVELQLDATPPAATIRDCVDATEWLPVFEESGNPVADRTPDRYVMRLHATLYQEGWLLHTATVEEDAQC